jgi:hypothetical protein
VLHNVGNWDQTISAKATANVGSFFRQSQPSHRHGPLGGAGAAAGGPA